MWKFFSVSTLAGKRAAASCLILLSIVTGAAPDLSANKGLISMHMSLLTGAADL